MIKNNKGFVLIETIIVMSVISIGLIYIYSNFNNMMNTAGKVNYYDNVNDIYTAYYAYRIYNKFNGQKDIIVDNNNPYYGELNNLGIKTIHYLNKNESTPNALASNILKYDGSTINYVDSIKNKVQTNECINEPCLTIVKIERDGKHYFAKYEAY